MELQQVSFIIKETRYTGFKKKYIFIEKRKKIIKVVQHKVYLIVRK